MIVEKSFTEKMAISIYTSTYNYLKKDTIKNPVNHESRLVAFYDEVGDLVVVPLHNVKKIVFHY